jgi:hypothetical protein
MGIANQYLALYGIGAWDQIRSDRTILENASGKLDKDYREAEHFLYALLYNTPENGWLINAIATEGYWITKAISNAILRYDSPWEGSPVSWDELIAGLYGGYCAAFGCAGVIGVN